MDIITFLTDFDYIVKSQVLELSPSMNNSILVKFCK